jgi:hypothetical protein
VTFPHGLLRSFSSEPSQSEPYISAPAVESAPIVEVPPDPERIAGVGSPASQTEVWFSGSRRLVRLGGIYPIRPDDPHFLANNQYAYNQVFAGEIECVESANGETFRCQNTKGEDIANLLVNAGLASFREIVPGAATDSQATDTLASSSETSGGATPLEVSSIRWRSRPNERDFARLYPPEALRANQPGRVVLDCLIRQDGALSCSAAEEDPTGAGFADAAIALSGDFRASSRAEDGQRTAGRSVRLTLVFRPEN